jgi:quercetin dioxygenase-like cupin family protein
LGKVCNREFEAGPKLEKYIIDFQEIRGKAVSEAEMATATYRRGRALMPNDPSYKPHLDPKDLTELETPYAKVRPFSAERMTFNFVNAKAGATLDTHTHEEEQFSVIHSGRARFEVEGFEPFELGPQEVFYVKPGVAHSVLIIEDMISLDVFSPVMEGLKQRVEEAEAKAS